MGWRGTFFAFGMSSAVALAAPPVSPVTPVAPVKPVRCLEAPFGAAEQYNLFVLGDLDHRNTDTEGRVAVGGSARFDHYSIGHKIVPKPGAPEWALVVGRDLVFTEGTVWAGPVACGGTCRFGYTATAYHGVYRATPIDFAAAQVQVWNLARTLAKVEAKGVVSIEGRAINLVGDARGMNVFTVPGTALAAATYLTVRVPEGATVVVNVSGTSTAMRDFGFKLTGVSRQQVVFNFFEATELTLSHVGIEGTVLAPFAGVAFSDGVIHGGLIAQAMRGNGQMDEDPFAGCLESPEAPTGGRP